MYDKPIEKIQSFIEIILDEERKKIRHDEQCELAQHSTCQCLERRKADNRDLFIKLWTHAGPAPDYNKKLWLEMESRLMRAGFF